MYDFVSVAVTVVMMRHTCVLQTKSGMGEVMDDAIFSMTEAKFSMGDFNQRVLNGTDKARLKATARKDNVAGLFSELLTSWQ